MSKRIFKTKKINVLGEKYIYKVIPQLANKLGVGSTYKERRENAKKIIENVSKDKIIIDAITGDFTEINLQDKPLMIKKFFEIKKMNRDQKIDIVINNPYEYTDEGIKEILIYDKDKRIDHDTILNVTYEIIIRIYTSSNDGTLKTMSRRSIHDDYKGEIEGDEQQTCRYLKKGFFIEYNHNYFKEDKEDNNIYARYGNYNGELNEDTIKNYYFKRINNGDDIEYIDDQDVEYFGNFMKKIIYEDLSNYDFCTNVLIESIHVFSNRYKNELDITTMKMLLDTYDNIKNIFGEIIDIDTSIHSNCTIAYLTQKFKQIRVEAFFKNNNIDFTDGLTVQEIQIFCAYYNIKHLAYDINKNIIFNYKPEKKNKCYGALIYISHNSHIYPLKNKYLKCINTDEFDNKLLTQNQIDNKFNRLIKKKIMPNEVETSGMDPDEKYKINIKQFTHKKTRYFANDDYEYSLRILKLYGLEDKIETFTNRYNIAGIIEKVYNLPNIYSFFPQLDRYKIPMYNFLRSEMDINIDDNELETIDKNKMFAYALSILPFLLSFDIRTNKTNKIEIDQICDINESFLYFADPEQSSILMPSPFFYSGYHLIYCSKIGLKFKITYEFETRKNVNKYSELIDDFFNKIQSDKNKYDNDDDNDNYKIFYKMILNVMMGKFERPCGVDKYNKVSKICDKEEAKRTDSSQLEYNDNYIFCYNTIKTIRAYTKKIISIQIKEMMHRIVYEKMVSLGLSDKNKDVIQINCDSITYIKNNNSKSEYTTDYKGWKQALFNTVLHSTTMHVKQYDDIFDIVQFRKVTYIKGLGGCGKTFYCINKIIPYLKRHNKSFLVLSPSHIALKEYRENDIECTVIQTYEWQPLPTQYDVIILDEIGLCDKKAHDILYKCHLSGCELILMGDFNQLLPVEETSQLNSDLYMKYMITREIHLDKNYRNNFSNDYYESLINNKINVENELKKYNTLDYKKADIIICYHNKIVDKYNELMMKHLNINFGDIGCKVMCKTNELKDYNIYNNFMLKVTKKTKLYITLDDNIKIPLDIFFKKDHKTHEPYFKPAYARTIYNMQSDSCSSYHIPDEEIIYLLNPRIVYTIISRIQLDENDINDLNELKKDSNKIKDNNTLFTISL